VISSKAHSAAQLQSSEASLHGNEARRSSRKKASRKEEMKKFSLFALRPQLKISSPATILKQNGTTSNDGNVEKRNWGFHLESEFSPPSYWDVHQIKSSKSSESLTKGLDSQYLDGSDADRVFLESRKTNPRGKN